MALQAKNALFTDKDPNGPEVGRVLQQGDPDAKFRLVGKGGVVSDELVKKFDLKKGEFFDTHDPNKAAAEREETNRATYDSNVAVTKAHAGYPKGGDKGAFVTEQPETKTTGAPESESAVQEKEQPKTRTR